MTERVVGPDDVGARLDVVVAGWLGISRSQAAARIAAGEVRVDGTEAPKQHRLRPGQRLTVSAPAAAAPSEPAPAVPPIRYEDEHLLVLAKPAGLVVHPGHGHPDGTLVDALRAAGIALAPAGGPERPGIVHRLDRGTSGLLVVAKTDAAHAGLVSALQRREVTRRYLALVQSVPKVARGRIEAPLGRDPRDRTRFAVVVDGRDAVTRYVVVDEGSVTDTGGTVRPVALLTCTLETGRTHQIRVHLTTLGHPLIGDTDYRASPGLARTVGIERPALHAAALAFTHPVTGAAVDVVEPVPPDLAAAFRRVGVSVPEPLADPG